MQAPSEPEVTGLWQRLSVGVTLLFLIGIGYCGHQTHWSFGIHGEHAAASVHGDAHEVAADQPQSAEVESDPSRIDFPSDEAIRKSGITIVSLSTRTMVETIAANAVVTYDERHLSQISSRVAGTCCSIHKRWGERVSKGDVLCIVESVEIGRLKAEFLNNLALSETRKETMRLLREASQSIPTSRLREVELQAREANIHLHNAEQTLVNMGLPVRVEDFLALSDEERARKIHFIGFPEAMTATMNPETMSTNLVAILAPFDGVVISRDAGIGEWTEPSRMLFEVANLQTMWLKLDIRKEDAARIRLGQRVVFRPDGLEQDIQCQITWISTEVNEETRTLQVRADVTNPLISGGADLPEQRLLLANTFGTARVQVRENVAALVVPQECLQTDTDSAVVFVRQGDLSFQAVPVQRGVDDGEFVEVTGNLTLNDCVACEGSHVIKSQMVLNRLAAAE